MLILKLAVYCFIFQLVNGYIVLTNFTQCAQSIQYLNLDCRPPKNGVQYCDLMYKSPIENGDNFRVNMTNVPESLSISEPSLSSSQLSEPTPSTTSQTTATDAEQQIPSSQQSIYQIQVVIDQSTDNYKAVIAELSPVPLHEDVKLKEVK
ncbi:hypothetical protein QE152_g36857 [Popillia japonica]|uniref:Uncharacterized protein n=1 Tax=Popillia japonica TaxID=7064 RepID=A0AAW1ICC7_POPJA